MEKLTSILNLYLPRVSSYIKRADVDLINRNSENKYYDLTVFVDTKKLQRYLTILPTFIDGTGKVKKDLVDKPFNSFTIIADNRTPKSISDAKKLDSELRRDFYLTKKMSGSSDFPTAPVRLSIVLE